MQDEGKNENNITEHVENKTYVYTVRGYECTCKYTGDWKNDKPEGNGKLYDEDGKLRYEGNFVDGNFNGKGIFYYNNGDRYEGNFVDGKCEGKGEIYYKDGKILYDGDFKNNKCEGKGTFYYNNGDHYEGNFVDGKCEGKGIYYYKDGDHYEGDFKNGKYEGKGKIYYKDGKLQYDGDFKNGKYEGKGKLYRKDGTLQYDGNFVDGNFNGKGIYCYNNEDRYEGNFVDGKREGKGIYYYKNGDRYEGDFVNGEGNGKGIYYRKDGGHYEGDFKNNKYHGIGILYRKNGDCYDGKFENSLLCNGVITFANGIEAEIKNYECVNIKRPLNIKDLELKHANGYMIDFRTDKRLNQFRKIGRYGGYKDIMADEKFLEQDEKNINVEKSIEEKIKQVCEDVKQKIKKGINQITLSLFIHGNEKQYLRVKKQYVLSLLEKLSEILKKNENVKIYIENLACYASTNFKECIQDPHLEIKDLENAISSYFGESCANRVFYTKSAVPDEPVMYEKTTDKHHAKDENETKFDYYRLTGKNLVKYDGEHDNAKQQKNADLHGKNKEIKTTVIDNLENKDKDKKNSII